MTIEKPGKDNIICQECGLWKSCESPFMPPSGVPNPTILVIGEAPGESEDRRGVPFVGRSGKLLRSVLEELDLIGETTFTNVVRCRPPNNKISKKYINSCSRFAEEEIDQYDPEFVFLMGNSPLGAILDESGITTWNGVVVERDRKYVPLYHPAYILRNDAATDEWLTGIVNALDSKGKRRIYEYVYPKTLDEIWYMRDEISKADVISYDLETTSLDPFDTESKVIAVSIGVRGTAYAFPLYHKDSWFIGDERKNVIDTLHSILDDSFIIGHNIKFDLKHSIEGLDIGFTSDADTMLISHLLDSRRGIHSLKRLAGIHAGMYDYDRGLRDYIVLNPKANPNKGGNYGEIPLDILLPYAAKDAEATLKVYDSLYPQLSEKQKILLEEFIMPASDALSVLERNGMTVDEYLAWRYFQIYNRVRDEIYDRIADDQHVRKMTSRKQSNNGKYWFNPGSWQQLGELLYDKKYYGLPVLGRTDSGEPSTKNAYLKEYEEEFPIVKDIIYYKLLSKMLNTYLGPANDGAWSSSDGKVRTTFNLHGSKTGRLSSSDPVNLQNIPTPEKEPGTLLEILPIKNIFTHSYVNPLGEVYKLKFFDGALLMADFSGMELRVFASLSKCYPMIDIFKVDKDVHSCVAIMAMTGKLPKDISYEEIKQLPKPVRYRYKWTNWTLLYGGGKWTLINMYDMTEEEAEDTIDKYYSIFPQVLDYKDECVEFAEDHGYIESPFGRREFLPYINDSGRSDSGKKRRAAARRQAVNMPVQSAASDITLMSLIVIEDLFRYYGFKSKLVNTVHDSVALDCPADEVKDAADLCKDVMENITDYAKDYFPNIDMSWLIAPLKADVKVGSHYGLEMGVEEWLIEQMSIESQ